MAKDWWFKFEWNDWVGDTDLNRCSLETQGFWIKCLCKMHQANSGILEGTVDELRRLLGILPEELTRCLQDLKRNNAADVIFGNGTVSVLSRRLSKELKLKEYNKLQVRKSRCKSNVMPMSSDRVRVRVKNKKEEADADADASILVSIFEFWKETMSLNNGTQFTPKRKKLIQDRLKQGYNIERIKNAIRGCSISPFHNGENDTRTKYIDLELICRSGEKVEYFERIWAENPNKPKEKTFEQQKLEEAYLGARALIHNNGKS